MSRPAALRSYTGRDLYTVLGRIREDYPLLEPGDVRIRYRESPLARFTVLSCEPVYAECRRAGPSTGQAGASGKPGLGEIRGLMIEAASANPIRHLPANYQNNNFLRAFLMVFQHIMNSTTLKIDNFSSSFRPMECPPEFIPVLMGWLGADCNTAGNGQELRRFLQYALPLYGMRGTIRGLKARLELACGCRPEIIEGQLPGPALLISSRADGSIFDAENAENCFTVHFPLPRGSFSGDTLRQLSLIVRGEKPAHTSCYISFAQPARKRRKTMAINEDTRLSGEEGFFI